MCRLMVAALIAVSAGAAWGHWEERSDLPDWARRGRLHWCLHYSTADRDLVDLFAAHHQTLLHGGRFDGVETARHAADLGLRYMPYVCSRTVNTTTIAEHPELQEAVVLGEDGAEVLAYGNPVRRYGSLFTDAWPEHVRERTRRVWDQENVAAIFFDNAFWTLPDYHPQGVTAWQQWAREHGLEPGESVPSTSDGEPAAASRAFVAETLVAYHAGLREFCHSHEPPLLNSPNLGGGSGYGLTAVEAGAIDLVFYETASHPPFRNNAFKYKVGLAASHGGPTGMLMYLPREVASERGEKTWHEGMHHFFYPSSPLPEEFAIAAAEGAACGGSYIPNYSLFPSLPITDTGDPFNRRIYRELQRSYDFLAAIEDLYVAARPAGEVAILYSAATDLQNRRLQNAWGLSEALGRVGIPFEVLVADDMRRGTTGSASTLILPNVAYVDEETAEGILRFAREGGRVAITGQYAAYDPLGRPATPAAARELLEPLRLTSRGIRDWDLEGFEPEGPAHVKVTGDVGTASLVHDGPDGRYLAHIQISDESDGTSPVELSVDGRTVFRALLDHEDNSQRWLATEPFELHRGQTVTLTVRPDGGEPGRTHAILLVGADAGEGAAIGRGTVAYSPVGLEALEPDRMVEMLRPRARLHGPQTLFANLMDEPARGIRTVHLVNYDFRYEVEHPGLYFSDDGTAERRMFFGGAPVVVRKRITIDEPERVVDPVVEIYAFATPAAEARLVISLNGRDVGAIEAERIRRSGWVEVEVPRQALERENVVEVRAEGELDGLDRWLQISIDADTNQGNSSFSTDGGASFSSDDLSTDRAAQTGEYLIRIRDRAPGAGELDPDNLLANPGFEQTHVLHSETTLTVVPARDAVVELPLDEPLHCLAVSPDSEPQWLQGEAGDGLVRYTVPRIDIYTVLALAESRDALEPIREAVADAAPWSIPPVTEPLRPTTEVWQPYIGGFELAGGARSGDYCIACANADATDQRGAVQALNFEDDPPAALTLTGWSRCEDVSGPRDGHYSIWVDATCVDGTVYNGHNAPFEVGTHGWQQATLRLEPPAPLRTARVFLLFRNHSGHVWFDDIRLVRE